MYVQFQAKKCSYILEQSSFPPKYTAEYNLSPDVYAIES